MVETVKVFVYDKSMENRFNKCSDCNHPFKNGEKVVSIASSIALSKKVCYYCVECFNRKRQR